MGRESAPRNGGKNTLYDEEIYFPVENIYRTCAFNAHSSEMTTIKGHENVCVSLSHVLPSTTTINTHAYMTMLCLVLERDRPKLAL